MKKHCFLFAFVLVFALGIAQAEISVHFIDVGQADAAVILCDGQALMIDGGNVSDSSLIYSYLRSTLSLERIDYLISTHPHEDHVGGLSAALNACEVGTIYSPVTEYDSAPFNDFLRYTEKQGLTITVPSCGDTFNVGSAIVTFLSVVPESGYSDTNDMSLVVRIDYGEVSFLFTGDAGIDSEFRMLDAGVDLSADVLKVGHHGSVTSSSEAFIHAVNPSYAIISVGTENEYGLPNTEIVNMLSVLRVSVLRTDKHGDIILSSNDGEKLSMQLRSTIRKR